MAESDKGKVLNALEDLIKTCQAGYSATRATAYGPTQVDTTKEVVSVLRNDAISIHRLIYSNTTRLAIALGKPPPSYDAALVSITDLNTEVGQLVSCVSLIDSKILRNEIAWAAEGTIQALSSLAKHFHDKCQQDLTDDAYLVKTGAVHEAVKKAEEVSEDEFAAFVKTWKNNSEGLKDSLEEVKQMLEGKDDTSDSKMEEDDGGWEDALGKLPQLSEVEISRVKKLFPLFRFTTILHDKILSDHLSHLKLSQDFKKTAESLSSLLTFSNSLLISNDELVSALQAPQDVANIRSCIDLVMGTVDDFDEALGITNPDPTPDQLAKRLGDLSLDQNHGSTKWFQTCFRQIRKIHDTLSLDD